VYKDTHRLWKEFKGKHKDKEEKHNMNKKGEERDNEGKMKDLMKK
jgi:hypothetical protein